MPAITLGTGSDLPIEEIRPAPGPYMVWVRQNFYRSGGEWVSDIPISYPYDKLMGMSYEERSLHLPMLASKIRMVTRQKLMQLKSRRGSPPTHVMLSTDMLRALVKCSAASDVKGLWEIMAISPRYILMINDNIVEPKVGRVTPSGRGGYWF